MRTSYFFQTAVAALFVVVFALAATTDLAATTLSLKAMAAEDTTFLEEEAGISAYTNVGAVDLAKAKTAYRTVERETDEYILGSVALEGYEETEDVHVYVSKEGWMVAYYLKDEPAIKIMDWKGYGGGEITTTKLETGLLLMCDIIGKPLPDVKYYDFRYPEANKLMIVADAQDREGTDTFDIKIPSDVTVYERTWSLYAIIRGSIVIDGETISTGSGYFYGSLTPTQLRPDVFHIVSVVSLPSGRYPYSSGKVYVGIALVCREP